MEIQGGEVGGSRAVWNVVWSSVERSGWKVVVCGVVCGMVWDGVV